MCSGARRLLSVATLLMTANVARGQSVRELQRRFDVAVALRDSTSRLFDAARVARANAVAYSDTITIANGAIAIPTNADLVAMVRGAAAIVDSTLRERLGDRLSAMPPTMITVRTDTTGRERRLKMGKVNNGREEAVQFIVPDLYVLENAIEVYALARASQRVSMLMRWMSVPLPTAVPTNDTWRGGRLELASSHAAIARRCYVGDIGACKSYLGLTTMSDPVTAWYDSTGRHAIVEIAGEAGHLDPVPVRRCLAGADAVCIDLMRTSAALAIWSDPPASPNLRTTLVQSALVDGGRGSLGVLLERNDSVAVALSRAAKLPFDSVIAHWQQHVRDGGATSETVTPGIALLAVGWIAVFGAVATRSSRWR